MIISPMRILLKLDYAKFSVFNLLFSKVIEEKPMGVGSTLPHPLLCEGRVNQSVITLQGPGCDKRKRLYKLCKGLNAL